MAKQAIEGAKRSDSFHVDPFKVKLAGEDFECGPEDPLYGNVLRNKQKLEDTDVDSVCRLGVVTPIKQADKLEKVLAAGGTHEKAKTERKKSEGKAASGKPTPTIMRETIVHLVEGGQLRNQQWDDGFRSALLWVLGDGSEMLKRELAQLLCENTVEAPNA